VKPEPEVEDDTGNTGDAEKYLSREAFGLQPASSLELNDGVDPDLQFEVTNKYIWTKKEFKLPIKVNFEFEFIKNGEFIPVFSHNKKQWGSPNCDALSMYLSTKRADFTFRTGLFKSFPSVKRPVPGFNAEKNKLYKFEAEIYPTKASYSIDGKTYATTTYALGTIPTKGHFGFAVYMAEHKVVKNV